MAPLPPPWHEALQLILQDDQGLPAAGRYRPPSRPYLSPGKSRAIAPTSVESRYLFSHAFLNANRHHLGLDHKLAAVHERYHHEEQPRLVVEVEQAPIHNGLREPEPQEKGDELSGSHHAGVLQLQYVTGDLEGHMPPALEFVEAEPMPRAQPRSARGGGSEDGPPARRFDIGLLPVEVAPPCPCGPCGRPSATASTRSCTARPRPPGLRRTCPGFFRWRSGRRRWSSPSSWSRRRRRCASS